MDRINPYTRKKVRLSIEPRQIQAFKINPGLNLNDNCSFILSAKEIPACTIIPF
jgi:hypothetical protein